jgi:hypothetical protein
MIETEGDDAEVLESARSVVAVVNDSLVGHARHAAELASRAADPNDTVDPWHELGRAWNRTLRDGARFFEVASAMLDALAWRQSKGPDTTPAPVEIPPSSNPCPTTIGPVAASGQINAQGLRRRGEIQIAIPANQVQVVRDRSDPTRLNLQIEAGGMPRGLYEGTMTIGTAAAAARITYNLYVDF